MQPTPFSMGPDRVAVLSPASRPRLPQNLVIGILLIAASPAMSIVSLLWGRYGLEILTAPSGLVLFLQVQFGLGATGALLDAGGLAIVFMSLLGLLPRADAWSRWGPVLIFLGGVSFASLSFLMIAAAPAIYPPATGAYPSWLPGATFALDAVGLVASPLGMILSVIGIARGILARGTMPPRAEAVPGLPLSGDPGKGV